LSTGSGADDRAASSAKASSYRAGFVGIAGRPNAGKSTLLNALVGEKLAITAAQPQTTRTSIQGVLTTPEAQIVFTDTPGIHTSNNVFNKWMMDSVRSGIQDRDLVLYVADATRPMSEHDQRAVSALNRANKALLVLNKIDRIADKRGLLPLIARYMELFPFVEAVPISARNSDGIEDLKRTVIQYLPVASPIFPEDYITDQPLRFMAAEMIREQILHATREEVPHSIAILIETWEDKPNILRITATIYVERPGQKAILIGAKGEMLKKIGTEARHEIEKLVDRRVFLSLFVKVKPDWREDVSFLRMIDWRSMLGSDSQK
jgi:GTPase